MAAALRSDGGLPAGRGGNLPTTQREGGENMGTLNELKKNREQRFAAIDAEAKARKAREEDSAHYKRLYEASRERNKRLSEELDALREEIGVLRLNPEDIGSAPDTGDDKSDLGGD